MTDREFDALWAHVVVGLDPERALSIHGPEHWRRVERNGLLLAARTGADPLVVRLFALFHDAARVNDRRDDGHGARGADLAERLRGTHFELSDAPFALLVEACRGHTEGFHHADPTVGSCWDADRLDLGRCGIPPDARFFSTAFGRELVAAGGVEAVLGGKGR